MSGEKIVSSGVGSVPHTDPRKAVEHVFAKYSLPFFPQLVNVAPEGGRTLVPMLREVLTPQMIAAVVKKDKAALEAELGRAAEPGERDAANLVQMQPAWAPFKARLKDVEELKLQIAGPCTVAALLAAAVPGTDADELLDLVWPWIERVMDAWIAAVRLETRARLLFVWDDALLPEKATAGLRTRFARVQLKVTGRKTTLGVHCCATVPLPTLLAAFPGAALSLDLAVVDILSPEMRKLAARHLQQGGRFLYGVFDTRTPKLDVEKGFLVAREAAALAREGRYPAIFTGGCGTGLHKDTFEEALAEALKAACALATVS